MGRRRGKRLRSTHALRLLRDLPKAERGTWSRDMTQVVTNGNNLNSQSSLVVSVCVYTLIHHRGPTRVHCIRVRQTAVWVGLRR